MHSRRARALTALALVACLLVMPACLGPNHAVGHLAKWNMEFENKWAREGVFILVFPGYVLCGLGDLLIFNSWQWWTGVNPISRAGVSSGPQV